MMQKCENKPLNTEVNKGMQKSPQSGTFDFNKGKDGYRPFTVSDAICRAEPIRISKRYLLELEPALSDLDWQILKTIRNCRIVLGKQIGRLCFAEVRNPRANTTATNRKLHTLMQQGLITALNQRINCRLKGYVAYLYYLTPAGERILQIHLNEPEVRRRNMEPSTVTLAHTVSVAECYVQAVEACRAKDMELLEAQLEPDCWRLYEHHYKNYVLKPDLALVTKKQDWQDHNEPWYELRWFIEVDLNTENIQTILEKCRRYYDYYRCDIEQQLHEDVFPLVVWIVKNESRKQSLIKHIKETFPQYPRIFAVILPEEFPQLLRDELDMTENLCPL